MIDVAKKEIDISPPSSPTPSSPRQKKRSTVSRFFFLYATPRHASPRLALFFTTKNEETPAVPTVALPQRRIVTSVSNVVDRLLLFWVLLSRHSGGDVASMFFSLRKGEGLPHRLHRQQSVSFSVLWEKQMADGLHVCFLHKQITSGNYTLRLLLPFHAPRLREEEKKKKRRNRQQKPFYQLPLSSPLTLSPCPVPNPRRVPSHSTSKISSPLLSSVLSNLSQLLPNPSHTHTLTVQSNHSLCIFFH